MSHVTNIILKTAYDEDRDLIAEKFPMLSLTSEQAGGDKHMECDVFMGAKNYLDLDELVGTFRKAPWDDPENVQLLIQRQNENRFEEYLVRGGKNNPLVVETLAHLVVIGLNYSMSRMKKVDPDLDEWVQGILARPDLSNAKDTPNFEHLAGLVTRLVDRMLEPKK